MNATDVAVALAGTGLAGVDLPLPDVPLDEGSWPSYWNS